MHLSKEAKTFVKIKSRELFEDGGFLSAVEHSLGTLGKGSNLLGLLKDTCHLNLDTDLEELWFFSGRNQRDSLLVVQGNTQLLGLDQCVRGFHSNKKQDLDKATALNLPNEIVLYYWKGAGGRILTNSLSWAKILERAPKSVESPPDNVAVKKLSALDEESIVSVASLSSPNVSKRLAKWANGVDPGLDCFSGQMRKMGENYKLEFTSHFASGGDLAGLAQRAQAELEQLANTQYLSEVHEIIKKTRVVSQGKDLIFGVNLEPKDLAMVRSFVDMSPHSEKNGLPQ